jgi:hypothetical protein
MIELTFKYSLADRLRLARGKHWRLYAAVASSILLVPVIGEQALPIGIAFGLWVAAYWCHEGAGVELARIETSVILAGAIVVAAFDLDARKRSTPSAFPELFGWSIEILPRAAREIAYLQTIEKAPLAISINAAYTLALALAIVVLVYLATHWRKYIVQCEEILDFRGPARPAKPLVIGQISVGFAFIGDAFFDIQRFFIFDASADSLARMQPITVYIWLVLGISSVVSGILFWHATKRREVTLPLF